MTFHDALRDDLSLITNDASGPSENVVLVDGRTGDRYEMRAFFETPEADVQPGGASAPVLSQAPMLHVPLVFVQSAINRPLSRRDRFIVRGATYAAQIPREDGFGLIPCRLQLVDSDTPTPENPLLNKAAP